MTEQCKRIDVKGDEIFGAWEHNVMNRVEPITFRVGDGALAQLEVGPGLITIFGGRTEWGKSTLVWQLTVDALRLNPSLRAVVCSVEMRPEMLLDRSLSRLSGIPMNDIRFRRYESEHSDRIASGIATLRQIAPRLLFARSSFAVDHLANRADAFDAGLVVIDYVQRLQPPGNYNDIRTAMNATMTFLREIADSGKAIIAVSALARPKDANDPPGLSSLRESSELEYGCDDCYLLTRENQDIDMITLQHAKSRHQEKRDIRLRFNPRQMSFTDAN